jgi:hypothetical protein
MKAAICEMRNSGGIVMANGENHGAWQNMKIWRNSNSHGVMAWRKANQRENETAAKRRRKYNVQNSE